HIIYAEVSPPEKLIKMFCFIFMTQIESLIARPLAAPPSTHVTCIGSNCRIAFGRPGTCKGVGRGGSCRFFKVFQNRFRIGLHLYFQVVRNYKCGCWMICCQLQSQTYCPLLLFDLPRPMEPR